MVALRFGCVFCGSIADDETPRAPRGGNLDPHSSILDPPNSMPDRYARRILDHVSDKRYQPQSLKALVDEFDIPKGQRRDFREAAQQLLDAGQLVLGTSDTLGLPPVGNEMIGTYRSHERGFGFLVPDSLTEYGDLFIPPNKQGEAMDGDHVRAKVIRERGRGGAGKSPFTGKIVEILKRADRNFVGTLAKRGKLYVMMPDGRKLADPIIIRDATSSGAKVDDKIVVEIIDYPDARRNELAEGVIVEVLGEAGIPDVETLSVMRAHGLAEKFAKPVMDQARAAAHRMEDADDSSGGKLPDNREDLRDTLIITIDPPDAKDYDDAISIRKVGGSSETAWELGIHIADVAHFVEAGSALDEEAYHRGNSTYLPRKVIPMLPEVLSNGVCSLQEGVTRFAKSCFVTYDARGNVLTQRFSRSVICSAKRLTYLEAQALIDDDVKEARKHAKEEPKYSREVIGACKLMDELARVIRKRRISDGMISLGLPEVNLIFDDAGHVIDAEPEDDAFTHTIIEMFMVEANEASARLFHAMGVPMVRRVHPDPDKHGLKDLKAFARVAGYNIPANPSRKELQWLLDKVKGTPAQHAVHMAVLKTLSRAEYSPVLVGHFALASDHYTHFTSPIRRYTDFVVHRAINTVIDAAAEDKQFSKGFSPRAKNPSLMKLGKRVMKAKGIPDEEALTDIGRHCSDTERNSTSAERELRKYLVLQLMATKMGQDFDAVVSGVSGQGAFLEISRYLADGFVKLADLPGGKADRWKHNPATGGLVAQRSGKTIAIGDRFTVRIANLDLPRRQMELVIIAPHKSGKSGGKQSGKPGGKSSGKQNERKSHGKPKKSGSFTKHKNSGKVSKRKKSSVKKKQTRRKKR